MRRSAVCLALLGLWPAGSVALAETRGLFTLTARFDVRGSDGVVEGSRVFEQKSTGRFLAAFASGDLALIEPSSRRVTWWPLEIDASAAELRQPQAGHRSSGSAVLGAERIHFVAQFGDAVSLGAAASLRGALDPTVLRQRLPAYSVLASRYRCDEQWLRRLRVELDSRIRRPIRMVVLFGNWCAACERFVPRVLELEAALGSPDSTESGLELEFVGVLPTLGEFQDEAVQHWRVSELPIAIVLDGEEELGRFSGPDGFRRPERSLARILARIPSAPGS